MEKIRLQKWLAECGVDSRRGAEKMIAAGMVKVNGVPAQIGDSIDPRKDRVTVDGRQVQRASRQVYLMLHKPRGYITTMHDEMGRKCVAELVSEVPERIYPVGRLDRESEGLLLMTNDGAFANRMTHPSKHVPKTYRVTVRPGITEEQIAAMTTGMEIDGYRTAPAQVRVIEEQPGRAVVQIVLHEGRNRQIRNMCEQLGLEVARLKRTALGTLRLGMLQPGQWRELTRDELRILQGAGEAPENAAAGRKPPRVGSRRQGSPRGRNGKRS